MHKQYPTQDQPTYLQDLIREEITEELPRYRYHDLSDPIADYIKSLLWYVGSVADLDRDPEEDVHAELARIIKSPDDLSKWVSDGVAFVREVVEYDDSRGRGGELLSYGVTA